MNFTSKAIVLSRGEFGEADRYIEFYTQKWGVISALAKSARKSRRRYVGGLDLFCHNEIALRGDPRQKPYLIELTVLNSFQGIRDDLNKLLLAGNLTAWVKRLTQYAIPLPAIYTLLGQTLSLIEQTETREQLETLGLIFKFKLLSWLGLKPRLNQCLKCDCDVEGPVSFDIGGGGVLCRQCQSQSDVQQLSREEHQFLLWAETSRAREWQQSVLTASARQHLTHFLTQFTCYHTHVQVPLFHL